MTKQEEPIIRQMTASMAMMTFFAVFMDSHFPPALPAFLMNNYLEGCSFAYSAEPVPTESSPTKDSSGRTVCVSPPSL